MIVTLCCVTYICRKENYFVTLPDIVVFIHSFIHVHMIYSRHHNGPCDMEQVKICIE